MKPVYFDTYHYRDYIDYCSKKCIFIIENIKSVNKNKLIYFRSMYKGYLYCMKLFKMLLKNKKRLMNYEIYNHLKNRKSSLAGINNEGEKTALYDLLNFITDR